MSRPRKSRKWWAKTVRAWNCSGQTAVEFAKEHDLNEHSLRWWKWKLGEDDEAGEDDELVDEDDGGATGAIGFVELDASGSWSPRGLELVSPSGWTVRLPTGFSADELARVVAVMEVGS